MFRKLLVLTLGLVIVFISGPALALNNAKHLKDLSCAVNEIARFNGIEWQCSLDENTDTLGDLSCDTSQIAEYDGNEWVCADKGGGGSPFVLKNGLGGVVGNFISLGITPVSSLSADMEVNTSLGTRNIVFAVRNDGEIITPRTNGIFFFQNETCSDPAYVAVGNPVPKAPAFSPALLIPDTTSGVLALYVAPNNPSPQLLDFIRFRGLDPLSPCNPSNANTLVYPFSSFELIDSDLVTSNPPPYTLHRLP